MSHIFQLKQVTKMYGETAALKTVSLDIQSGERVALIGPSGAGKTTLLNVLAGSIHSDSGTTLLDGKLIGTYSDRKALGKKVGMIRQQFDLVGELAVIHNVLAGRFVEWSTVKSLISLVIPQDKPLAVQALERLGIADKAYQKTSTLSGGQQQRVAMARLLVQKPEAILADEPVASLDPSRAEDVLSKLVTLAAEEKSTLVASLHSIEYAKKYFDRLIALKGGSLFFDLPTSQVTSEQLAALYVIEGSPNESQSESYNESEEIFETNGGTL